MTYGMKHRHSWRALIALFAVVLISGSQKTAALERVDVRVRPAVAVAPATVRVVVWVEHDENNRELTVELDLESYYRSSERGLEGSDAARLYDFLFDGLPSGVYEVRSTVGRADGSSLIKYTQIEVVGVS